MARGVASPSPALPKVSFTKVVDDVASSQPPGVHEHQARSFGYNDFSPFQRPEPYIRYIEPLESDLAVQVEYDMDEQDQEWLDAVNSERRNDQLNKVSYETFEIIMDRLEKEWFDLTKNIPKPDMALPSEDSTCAICDDAEGENSNAIVFCDGCNLAVHQDCYGVPYIPEGQWLCRKCTVSPEVPVSCMLCPNEGGAFKQTVNGEWVHLLCAIWVPETRVANEVFMEPVTGVEKINKQRWKLKCSLCGVKEGACIQCSKTSCFLAFHTTCARKEKLLMPMKSAHGAEPATLACYCEKHLPKEQLAAHEAAVAELDRNNDANVSFSSANGQSSPTHPTSPHTPRSSKKARAYAKTYRLGPPLVPDVIVRHILDYIAKINVRKKQDFIQLVCRYWSLKREARRGAPLLKRLHLEPWTASSVGKIQTDEDKAMRLEHLRRLRRDLEAVRMLAELTRKREAQKLKQTQVIQEAFAKILFEHVPHLRVAFETIIALDRNEFFKNPVSKSDVPDYFDIIEKPMCWRDIDGKLDRNEYWNLQDFKDDIYLVLDNAIRYNTRDSAIHRAALRIKAHAERSLSELEQLPRRPPSETQPPKDMVVEGPSKSTRTDGAPQTTIGDLEPPLSVLSLFLADGTSAIMSDPEFPHILTSDPLTSLFAYEFEKPKPPPPPTSPHSHRSSKSKSKSKRSRTERPGGEDKPKRDRAAEKAKRLLLFASREPGYRPPGPARTRNAKKALEAFEREAGAPVTDGGDGDVGKGEGDVSMTSQAGATTARDGGVVGDEDGGVAEGETNTDNMVDTQHETDTAETRAHTGVCNDDVSATVEPVEAVGYDTKDNESTEPIEVDTQADVEASKSVDSIPSEAEADTSTESSAEATAEHVDTAQAQKRSRQRNKRAAHVLPGQAAVPPVVENVDNQQSFMMFDKGWILPANQRRGGRPPIERQEVPRKKQRAGERENSSTEAMSNDGTFGVDRQHSALSMYSTPASENQTLRLNENGEAIVDNQVLVDGEGSGVKDLSINIKEEHDHEVRLSEVRNTEAPPEASTSTHEQTSMLMDTDAQPSVHSDYHGLEPYGMPPQFRNRSRKDRPPTKIIEKLDSPATRRAENQQRKRRRMEAKKMAEEQERLRLEEEHRQQMEAAGLEAPAPRTDAVSTNTEPDAGAIGVPDEQPAIASGSGVDNATASMDMDESELSSLSSIDGDHEDGEEEMEIGDINTTIASMSIDGSTTTHSKRATSSRSRTGQKSRAKSSRGKEEDGAEGGDEDGDSPQPRVRPQMVSVSDIRKMSTPVSSGPGRPKSADIVLNRGEMLEGGTLVWAKAETYPWWPAVVYEDDDPDVPKQVLKERERTVRPPPIAGSDPSTSQLHLVRFWDGKRQWQWLTLDRLKLLGEDKVFDGAMLAGTAKGQRFKNARVREQCRTAFRNAISEMETGEGAEIESEPYVSGHTSTTTAITVDSNTASTSAHGQAGIETKGTADRGSSSSELTPAPVVKLEGSVGVSASNLGEEVGRGGDVAFGENAENSGVGVGVGTNPSDSTSMDVDTVENQDAMDADVDTYENTEDNANNTNDGIDIDIDNSRDNTSTSTPSTKFINRHHRQGTEETENSMEMVMQLGVEVDTESALTETEL